MNRPKTTGGLSRSKLVRGESEPSPKARNAGDMADPPRPRTYASDDTLTHVSGLTMDGVGAFERPDIADAYDSLLREGQPEPRRAKSAHSSKRTGHSSKRTGHSSEGDGGMEAVTESRKSGGGKSNQWQVLESVDILFP